MSVVSHFNENGEVVHYLTKFVESMAILKGQGSETRVAVRTQGGLVTERVFGGIGEAREFVSSWLREHGVGDEEIYEALNTSLYVSPLTVGGAFLDGGL